MKLNGKNININACYKNAKDTVKGTDLGQYQKLEEIINGDKRPITERVKTFRDACGVLGKHVDTVLPYQSPLSEDESWLNTCLKISIITRALNEGWKPDYSNKSQRKYYPYFEYKGASGFVFYVANCSCEHAATGCGVRQVFKTEDRAKHAGRQFAKEYNEYLS